MNRIKISKKSSSIAWRAGSIVVAGLGLSVLVVGLNASAADAKRKARKLKRPRAPVHKIDACQILTPQIAVAVGAPKGTTPKKPGKYGHSPHPRCTYEWPVPNRDELQKKYVADMMERNKENIRRMGRSEARLPSPRPPVLAERVGLTWLKTSKSPDAAKAEMAHAVNVLAEGITARTNIKDGKATVRVNTDKMDARTQARARALEKQGERQLKPVAPALKKKDREIKTTFKLRYVSVPGIGDEAVWSAGSGSLMVRKGAQRFTVDAQVVPFSRDDQKGYDYATDKNFIVAKKAAIAIVAKAGR